MNFSAALFAGGRSSRMGRDKAFLEIDGAPLWQRQLHTLRKLGPSEIFLSGRTPSCRAFLRNATAPAIHNTASDTDALQRHPSENAFEIVADAVPDAGPLGGLVAVLRRSKNTRLLVLAVDLPNMTSEFLRQLLTICSHDGGVVPRRNERFEPLAAIYPARCLALAESCLNAGEYSLQELARRATNAGLMTTKEITDIEASLFFNLNTPADLAAIGKK